MNLSFAVNLTVLILQVLKLPDVVPSFFDTCPLCLIICWLCGYRTRSLPLQNLNSYRLFGENYQYSP